MRLKVVLPLGLSSALIVGSALNAFAADLKNSAVPLSPELAAQLSRNVNRPVIVVMAGQSGAAVADMASVMSELAQVKATNVKPYHLVHAFAATVSDGEMARLRANPSVAEVVPDVVIRHATRSRSTASSSAGSGNALSPPANYIPKSCAPDGSVQLNPEALLTTNTESDNPKVKTAHALGITGAGVKVAWIADGIDPKNPNFIRPDGTPVFIDYQDFTGDGPGQLTTGARHSSTRVRSRRRAM